MKIRKTELLCVLITLLAYTQQRKSFLVKEQHPALLAPKVQNYDTSFKLFDMTTPLGERYKAVVDNQVQVEAGFDFKQKTDFKGTNNKYWAIRNNFFIRQDAVLHPEVVLDKYYKGEMFLEIPKFQANIFWQIIWFQ